MDKSLHVEDEPFEAFNEVPLSEDFWQEFFPLVS